MNDYAQFFGWSEVHLHHFYIYFAISAVIAFYLVIKSDSKHKFELFFLAFYLLTGNLNELLTIVIPGFSLFEIQPLRLIFFLLLFFIVRKTLLSRERYNLSINGKIPWFMLAIFGYVILMMVSLLVNSPEIGISMVLKRLLGAFAFLVLIISLQLMADKPTYNLIGLSIIIAAVFSSLISLIQLTIDPYFLRIGSERIAFAGFIRSNGIFSAEYFNSYFLITAIAWTLTTIKTNWIKIALIGLFTLGVLSTFQRMSWIILILVLATYFIFIKQVAIEKMVLIGLSGLALLLSVSIFYYQDIMNSSLVKERLTDSVDSRKGYYTMVLDNIGERPIFGYGGLKNEVYYVNLLRITGDRNRATAEEGDLHSGYFSALFLYGVPACVCFIIFVVSSVFYYSRSIKYDLYFVIPFLVGIIYMIANLTNSFLFLKYISVLYALHIGIGMGINQLNEEAISKND